MNIDGDFKVLPSWSDLGNLLKYKSKQTNISLICTNIRSIKKYWDTFTGYVNFITDYVDIIVLLEISISEEEAKLYNVKGYSNFYKCRDKGNGGGILLLCKNYLKIQEVELNLNTCSMELLLVRIKYNKENILLAAIYRPPRNNVNEFNRQLEDILACDIVRNENNMLIVGDINICYLSRVYGSDFYFY